MLARIGWVSQVVEKAGRLHIRFMDVNAYVLTEKGGCTYIDVPKESNEWLIGQYTLENAPLVVLSGPTDLPYATH